MRRTAEYGVQFARMPDRRYKQVKMSPEAVIRAAFPEGTGENQTITAVWYDFETDTFRFKIHSPHFPTLRELEIPPVLRDSL